MGATINVNVIVLKQRMSFPCRECGRVLAEGKFSVGIVVKYDDDTVKNYALCKVPPVVCCERALEVQQLFATKQEAASKADEINSAMMECFGKPDVFTFWLNSNFIEIP